MPRALEEIAKYLKKAGLKEDQINELLSRFLEEEAYEYVRTMDELKDDDDNNNGIPTTKTYSTMIN